MLNLIKIVFNVLLVWHIALPALAGGSHDDWIARPDDPPAARTLNENDFSALNQKVAEHYARQEKGKIAWIAAGLALFLVLMLWRAGLLNAGNLFFWLIVFLVVAAIFSALYRALDDALFLPVMVISAAFIFMLLKYRIWRNGGGDGDFSDFIDDFFDGDSDGDSSDGGGDGGGD